MANYYFFQWAKFYDLTDSKVLDAFPFYLEGNAKIWYDALPDDVKSHPNAIKVLFQDRFKELDNFLDLSVLQMKQNIAESVTDYLSRLIKTASIKNVPEKVLLSVAMNGLRSDIKTFVVTQNPTSMEQLRQTAILAEKSQPPQTSTLETYENLLQEIKTLKDQVLTQNAQVNAIQHANPQPSYHSQTFPTPSRFRNTPPFRNRQVQSPRYRPRTAQNVPQMQPPIPYQQQPPIAYQQPPVHPHGLQQCSYCLGFCQSRMYCPAKNASCHSCGKFGHFSRACRLAAKPAR